MGKVSFLVPCYFVDMDGVGKWTSQRVKIGEFKFEKWLNYLEHVSFQSQFGGVEVLEGVD